MKKHIISMTLCILLCSGTGTATSLWSSSETMPYADSRGRGIGSIVTVIISESAQATQRSTTTTDATGSNEASGGTGFLQFMPLGTSNTESSYSGSGSTSRSGTLVASITAQVIEELPNGLMRIEGTRRVKINDELQEITIRGLIRSEDIKKNNTIESVHLADAEIMYRGLGAVGRTQRPGIIHRLFHFLF